MGERAREAVQQRFTVQIQAHGYLRLYEQLRAGAIHADEFATDTLVISSRPLKGIDFRSKVY